VLLSVPGSARLAAYRKARRRAVRTDRKQAVLRRGERFFVMDCPVSVLSMYETCRRAGVELVELVCPKL
jgi:hypothetical protein